MTWADMITDWPHWSARIRKRFPYLESAEMERTRHDRGAFEAYLASSHNLSRNEAREEIEDLLFIETLSREVSHLN